VIAQDAVLFAGFKQDRMLNPFAQYVLQPYTTDTKDYVGKITIPPIRLAPPSSLESHVFSSTQPNAFSIAQPYAFGITQSNNLGSAYTFGGKLPNNLGFSGPNAMTFLPRNKFNFIDSNLVDLYGSQTFNPLAFYSVNPNHLCSTFKPCIVGAQTPIFINGIVTF
jgi:hypothetical protein